MLPSLQVFDCVQDQVSEINKINVNLNYMNQMPQLCFIYVYLFIYLLISVLCQVAPDPLLNSIQFQFGIRVRTEPSWLCLCTAEVVRELWNALVCWRHSMQPLNYVLVSIHLQRGWRWTNLKSPIRVVSQYLSGGKKFVLWKGFFVAFPSPISLVFEPLYFSSTHPLHV